MSRHHLTRERRRRQLSSVIELRDWMARYPEIFFTPLHQECFVRIALATLDTDTVTQMKAFYRSLPCSENAARAYLRSLANAGWISYERSAGADRRTSGFRIGPRFKAIRDEYFECLDSIHPALDAAPERTPEAANDEADATAAQARAAIRERYLP